MSATFQYYINGTRRLLKDSGAEFYGTSNDPTELTEYINEARRRVSIDAALFRKKETVTFTQSTEIYTLPTVSGFRNTFSALRIWINIGTNRGFYLSNKSYTELKQRYLAITGFTSWPVAWAKYSETQYSIAPLPNQNYTAELDLLLVPNDITDPNITDSIPFPWADMVKWWAAYVAYNKDKAYAESDRMIQSYEFELLRNLGEQVPFISMREFRPDYWST